MTTPTNPLDRAALEAQGITGWAYGLSDRVRFDELDVLRHVNNISYLHWFEELRVRYFVDYGLTAYAFTDDEPQLVVRHQTADFLAPLHMHQSYTVAGRISILKPSSFVLSAAVFAGGEMKAKSETVMISVGIDGVTRKPHNPGAVEKIIALDAPEVRT